MPNPAETTALAAAIGSRIDVARSRDGAGRRHANASSASTATRRPIGKCNTTGCSRPRNCRYSGTPPSTSLASIPSSRTVDYLGQRPSTRQRARPFGGW